MRRATYAVAAASTRKQSAKPDARHPVRPPRGAVGVAGELRRQRTLARAELLDQARQLRRPRAAVVGRGERAARADAGLARARDHGVRVVVDVGERVAADRARASRRCPGSRLDQRLSSSSAAAGSAARVCAVVAEQRRGCRGSGSRGSRLDAEHALLRSGWRRRSRPASGARARPPCAGGRSRSPGRRARPRRRRRSAPRRPACGPSAVASCDPLVRVRARRAAGRAPPGRSAARCGRAAGRRASPGRTTSVAYSAPAGRGRQVDRDVAAQHSRQRPGGGPSAARSRRSQRIRARTSSG